MRFLNIVLLSSLALGVSYCGKDSDKSANPEAAELQAIPDLSEEDVARISEDQKSLSDAVVRIPVVDGVEQVDKAEIITVSGPLELKNAEQAEALFANNDSKTVVKTGLDELDESSSTNSWWGCRRRCGYPFRGGFGYAHTTSYAAAGTGFGGGYAIAHAGGVNGVYTPYQNFGAAFATSSFAYHGYRPVRNCWFRRCGGRWCGGRWGGYPTPYGF